MPPVLPRDRAICVVTHSAMSDFHYSFLLLFLLLHVPLSLGYRDGAREDSCYDHAITHLIRPGRPPTMKILCDPPTCPYNLTLVGEVQLTNTSTIAERIGNSDEYLRCDSVYMCKLCTPQGIIVPVALYYYPSILQ